MVILLVIIIYIIIGFIEIPNLYRSKQKKELVIYSVTFSFAFLLSFLLSIGVKVPSPAKSIEKIVMFILGTG